VRWVDFQILGPATEKLLLPVACVLLVKLDPLNPSFGRLWYRFSLTFSKLVPNKWYQGT